ncbi:MAG: NPCBM/NEW2 domain-containing protein [Lachnospiraceae bacterium]|nr:NPCBM/NEW2 domain-containing protein [Lachnospiraceae bacterium]
MWAIRQTERDTETLNDFDIIADGKSIYSSPAIKGGDVPVFVEADLDGCSLLTILFTEGSGQELPWIQDTGSCAHDPVTGKGEVYGM